MRFILLLGLILFLVPFVSSTIVFHESIEDLYNVGEMVDVNFSVKNTKFISDFLEVSLECGNDSFVVYKMHFGLEADIKHTFEFMFPATIPGSCKTLVHFGEETEKSNSFEISDEIVLEYFLNNKVFSPLEKIVLNGTAVKKNGDFFEGGVLVLIPGLIETTLEVVNGSFASEFSILGNAAPQKYDLSVKAIEKNYLEEIINFGEKIEVIEVKSKPTSLTIITEESISPALNLSIKLKLLDQIDGLVENGTVLIKLFNPLNEIVLQKEVENNGTINYFFESDALKGGWKLNAYYGNLFATQPIYVGENSEIKILVVDEKILIENVGNVVYEGILSFDLINDLSNESVAINVNLEIGEILEPSFGIGGNYNISVGNEEFKNVHLTVTGAAIFFDSEFTWKSYVFSFLILFFLGLVYFLIKKRVFISKFFKAFFKNFKKEKSKEYALLSVPQVAELGGKKNRKRFFKKKPSGVKITSLPTGYKNLFEVTPKNRGLGGQFNLGGKEIIHSKQLNGTSSGRKAYMIFLDFTDYFNEIVEIAQKYKISFNKINNHLGYFLFYSSSDKKPETRMFKFATEIMRVANSKGSKLSMALNSGKLENKASSLKKFALVNRKLVDFAHCKILITHDVFEGLNIPLPKSSEMVNVEDEDILVYFI